VKLSVACAVLILSICSFASPVKVGNGGGGILSQDMTQVQLLDLVEAGVEKPIFNDSVKNDFFQAVSLNLNPQDFPVELVSQKISEVNKVNPLLATFLLDLIKSLNWKFTNEALVETADLVPIIQIPPQRRVQIAVRSYFDVLISRIAWTKMNSEHRAALVLHELLSSLFLGSEDGYYNSPETALMVRKTTAFIFSEAFLSVSMESFEKQVVGFLPTSKNLTYFSSVPFWINPDLSLFLEKRGILPYVEITDRHGNFFARDSLKVNTDQIDFSGMRSKVCALANFDDQFLMSIFFNQARLVFKSDGSIHWTVNVVEKDLKMRFRYYQFCDSSSRDVESMLIKSLLSPL
jgi:hypothetical protein